jgi:VWFA-related protein
MMKEGFKFSVRSSKLKTKTAIRRKGESMREKLACLLIAFVMCLGPSVSAQQTAQHQTKPGEQDPTIKLQTELVEVRAVVTDRQGQVVSGLKKEDFELLENGKPQEVSFFSIARVAGDENRPSTPGTPAADNTDASRTSRERLSEAPVRTVVLFVDNLHLSASSLLQVKQALRRFIDEQLTEQDMVALVSSSGTLGLVEQFTRNRQILRYAIERLNPGPSARATLFTPYLAAQVERGDTEALDVAIEVMKQEEFLTTLPMDREERILRDFARARANQILAEASYKRQATLLTLKAVAERMAGLPGQRLIALFSDGFTLHGPRGYVNTNDLQDAVSRAVRSGVAIYSIDAKGLQPPSMFNAALRTPVTDTRLYSYQSASEKDSENVLNAVAKDTGGEAFFNTNDLGSALQQALDSNRFSYVLAYYPAEEGKSTQFRRLTIRVKNHPEYTVRMPKGYQPSDLAKAKKDEAAATPQGRLVQAMLSPLSHSEIVVSAVADFLESEMDQARVSVRVYISGDKLTYREQNLEHALSLEMLTIIYDSQGQRVDAKSENVQGNLKPDHLRLAKQSGYTYVRRVALKPGLYQVRVGVREFITERLGTATAWVEVPNLSSSKLTLSSLILLDSPAESALTLTSASDKTQGSAPLSSKLIEGIRFYPRGQLCAYFFRIYQNAKAPTNDLTMQTEFMQSGRTIAQSEWQPAFARKIGEDNKGALIAGQLQLEGLKPGIYELRITVKDPQSKRSVQRAAPFGVE